MSNLWVHQHGNHFTVPPQYKDAFLTGVQNAHDGNTQCRYKRPDLRKYWHAGQYAVAHNEGRIVIGTSDITPRNAVAL